MLNSIARFFNFNTWLILTCILYGLAVFYFFIFKKIDGILNLFLTVKVFTILLILFSQINNDLRKTYAIVMKKTAIVSNTLTQKQSKS